MGFCQKCNGKGFYVRQDSQKRGKFSRFGEREIVVCDCPAGQQMEEDLEKEKDE